MTILKGFITGSNGSSIDLTTDTAANIVGAIAGCEDGSSFRFILSSLTGNDVVLKPGSGVTLKTKNVHGDGSAGITVTTTSEFYVVVTDAATPAVDIIQIW